MDGGERRRADLKSVCFARHTCRHPTQCPFSDSAPEPSSPAHPVHFHGIFRSEPATSASSHSSLPTRKRPSPGPPNSSFQKQHTRSHPLKIVIVRLARQITYATINQSYLVNQLILARMSRLCCPVKYYHLSLCALSFSQVLKSRRKSNIHTHKNRIHHIPCVKLSSPRCNASAISPSLD